MTAPGAVERAAFAHLDARLERDVAHPLAVALSGGGDSLALLGLASAWSRAAGRRLLALTVDHRLHPDSGRWTAFAGQAARRAGAEWRALAWEGDKPAAGLPAAARAARHALLAEAARAAGARVILLAHTADDVAEGERMRAEGSSLGRLRAWGPSPAWPEGRGLMLLRPLLQLRRAELRAWLQRRGEAWLEDPGNADPRFARSRARAALAGTAAAAAAAPQDRPPGTVPPVGPAGELTLDPAFPWLAEALLCVSGTDRPPRGGELDRLRVRLAAGAPFRATLAGCRIAFDGVALSLAREPGRAGLSDLDLPPGRPVVWDGRFELTAGATGWRVGPLQRRQAALARADRAVTRLAAAQARPARPVLFRDGEPRPFLARPEVRVRALVGERLSAACGRIAHEADLGDAAHGEAGTAGLSFAVAAVSKATVVSSRTE